MRFWIRSGMGDGWKVNIIRGRKVFVGEGEDGSVFRRDFKATKSNTLDPCVS